MINIKKCRESQLGLLHDIALQSYNDAYLYLWSDNGASYLEEFYKKELFAKELSAPDIFYFLIYDGNQAIGYFKIKEHVIAPYPASQCLELDKLYLLKEHSGKGYGKIAMDFIIALSKEIERPVLWLKVMESSPAKFLYEKCGFVQTGASYLDYPAMLEEYRSIITMVHKI